MSLPEKIAACLLCGALVFAFVGFCVYTWLCRRQRRQAEQARREKKAARKKAFAPSDDSHWHPLTTADSPAFRFDDPTKPAS